VTFDENVLCWNLKVVFFGGLALLEVVENFRAEIDEVWVLFRGKIEWDVPGVVAVFVVLMMNENI
jgi:hypothetical protein